MAAKKWTGAKSTSFVGSENWNPTGVPATTSECEANEGSAAMNFPAGNSHVRWMIWSSGYTGKVTNTGGAVLQVTQVAGTALSIASATTWEVTGVSFEFLGTSGVGTVTTNGHRLPIVNINGAGTVKLEDALTCGTDNTGQSGILRALAGTFETNGKTVTPGIFEVNGGTVKLGSSLIVLNENGSAATHWEVTISGTVEAGTSTIEISSTVLVDEFKGGGKSYFNLTIARSKKQKIISANTFTGTVAINNKGAAAGEGVQLEASATQTIANLSTNGTSGEKSRLESTVSGTRAKIKITGGKQVLKNIIIKDIEVTEGELYVPEGTTLENTVGISEIKIVSLSATVTSIGKLSLPLSIPVKLQNEDKAKSSLSASLNSPPKLSVSLTGNATLLMPLVAAQKISSTLKGNAQLASTLISATKISSTLFSKAELNAPIRVGVTLNSTIAGTGKLSGSLITSVVLSNQLRGSGSLTSILIVSPKLSGQIKSYGQLSAELGTKNQTFMNATLGTAGKLESPLRVSVHLQNTFSSAASFIGKLIIRQDCSVAFSSVGAMSGKLLVGASISNVMISYGKFLALIHVGEPVKSNMAASGVLNAELKVIKSKRNRLVMLL